LVFLAALGVWLTGSGWPDIAVALILALLFLRSAASVIRGARAELEAAKAARAPLARPVTLSPITVRRRRPG
jgi:Co/Zn/Cd efflux system component